MNDNKLNCEQSRVKTRKRRSEQFRLNYQARILVYRLYCYFKKESRWGAPIKQLCYVKERVADAFEISVKTVSKVLKQSESELLKKVTEKRRKQATGTSTVEPFDECAVRNHIYSYYERREWPTRKKLVYTLNIADIFHGDKTSLDTVLDKIKFKWRKINNKKCLLEKCDVIAARCLFLQNIGLYNINKIIFLGETLIKVNIGTESKKVIVVHAGSADGFIPNCCLLINLESYKEVDAEVFKEWFIHTLLKNIPEKSVIVMENTPNRSVLKEKIPHFLWKKSEIQDWLTKHNIEWSPSMLKGVLLDLVDSHRPLKKIYELDEVAQEKGHTVIRLPVKHHEYNPIEMIWAQVKEKVAQEKITKRKNHLERLTRKAVNSITVEDWYRAVEHTADVIEEARIREDLIQENIEEMLRMGGEDWSSSSSQSESEYDETEEDEDELEDEEGEQEIPVSMCPSTVAITFVNPI